jgi:hypothetical protein
MGAEQSGESVADPTMTGLNAKKLSGQWAMAVGRDETTPNNAYALAARQGTVPEAIEGTQQSSPLDRPSPTEVQNFKLNDVFHPNVGMGEAGQLLQESAGRGMDRGELEDGHFLLFPGTLANGDKALRLMMTYDNSTVCRAIIRTSRGLLLDQAPTPCKSVPQILKVSLS